MTTTRPNSSPAPATDRAAATPATPLVVYGVTVAGLVLPAALYAAALGADVAHLDAAPVGAQVALVGQAVVPAVAALLAWRVARERPAWGFRRAPWRTLGTAWLVAVLAVGLGSGAAWATGAASFSAGALSAASGGLPALAALALALGPAVLPWMLLALGEQLGWSSFLATRLTTRAGTDRAALVVGAAWASFHLPLMLFVPGAVADDVPLGWAVAMFTGQCLALAFPLVWLRRRTASIWPVLVLHGTLNSALYLVAEPASSGGGTDGRLVGEGGLLTTLGVVAAVLLTRPLWRTRS